MKLRKSIWFALLLSMIGLTLSIEKAYGFSIHSTSQSKGFIFKKNTSDNQEKPISVFFEEENISENEDESTLDNPILWESNQFFLSLFHVTKVQLFEIKSNHYFSRYTHPLFIVFRNLRL